MSPPFIQQVRCFLAVGGVSTAVQYLSLITLVEILHMAAPLSAVLAYVAGGMVNYSMNARWTFRYGGSHVQAGSRFLIIFIIGLTLTWLLMECLSGWWGLNYLLSQVLVTTVVLLVNFVAHKTWTFAAPRGER